MSKRYALIKREHLERTPTDGVVKEIECIRVRVLAIAEGYAMVRRERAYPFVVPVKQLEDEA